MQHTHLRQTDRHVFANNVSYGRRLLSHLDLELLSLGTFRSNLRIKFFLLCDKVICTLFCLEYNCQSHAHHTYEDFLDLFLRRDLLLNCVDLFAQAIGIKVHYKTEFT